MNDIVPSETSRQAATEWLVTLQSPQLTQDQQQRFFAWLDQKQEHQQAYIEAEALWETLGAVEQLAPTQETNTNIHTLARPWYTRPQAVAASFVGLLVLVFAQFWSSGDEIAYQTAIGEQRQVTLADGSRVYLNTHSSIRVAFGNDSRQVHLSRGEAFFEVHKDAKRPFVVETPEGLVRVLGTRFNVRLDRAETTVTVEEGKVGIVSLDARSDAIEPDFIPQSTLVANQQIILAAGDLEQTANTVDASAASTWRVGKQVYDGVPLSDVIRDLNRYFVGEVKLGDPSLAKIQVVAVLDLRDRASAIAALESTFNIVATQKPDGLIVLYPAK